jgi:hypothetical protein
MLAASMGGSSRDGVTPRLSQVLGRRVGDRSRASPQHPRDPYAHRSHMNG